MNLARESASLKRSALPRAPSRRDPGGKGNAGGGGFSKRSPSPGPPPEERLGFELIVPSNRSPLRVVARFPAAWLWSRRLTEPPRPANAGYDTSSKVSGPKGWRGRSESHRLVPAGTKSRTRRYGIPCLLPQKEGGSSALRMVEDISLALSAIYVIKRILHSSGILPP